MQKYIWLSLLVLNLSGCVALSVAGAAVSVVSATVQVGAAVVGTTVELGAMGVKAIVSDDDDDENQNKDK